MIHWIKMLAIKANDLGLQVQNLHGGKRELILRSCALTTQPCTHLTPKKFSWAWWYIPLFLAELGRDRQISEI